MQANLQQLKKQSWVIFVGLCSVLAYLVIWQRGMYADDYYHHSRTSLQLFADARNFRPFGLLLIAILTIGGEVFNRIVMAGLSLCVALLAGQVVYRLSGSRLGRVLTACLVCVPLPAFETILWASTAAYAASAVCVLWAILQTLHWFDNLQDWRLACRIAILLVASVLFAEQAIIALLLLLLIGLVRIKGLQRRSFLLRFGALCTLVGLILALCFPLFYGNTVQSRGGMETSLLAARLAQWFSDLHWLTVAPDWGLRIVGQAFEMGRSVLNRNPWASLVLTLAVAALVAIVGCWQPSGRQTDSETTNMPGLYAATFVLVALLSVFVPGVLVANQVLAPRLLYIPYALLCIGLGAVIAAIQSFLRVWSGFERVVLIVVGIYTLFGAISLLGFAQLYVLRHEADQRQLAAVRAQLATIDEPEARVYVVLHRFEEMPLNRASVLNEVLLGVFERGWTAEAALSRQNVDSGMTVFAANRWQPDVHIAADTTTTVWIDGVMVPLEQLLVFTYRDEQLYTYTQIGWQQTDGGIIYRDLVLGEALVVTGTSMLDALIFREEG